MTFLSLQILKNLNSQASNILIIAFSISTLHRLKHVIKPKLSKIIFLQSNIFLLSLSTARSQESLFFYCYYLTIIKALWLGYDCFKWRNLAQVISHDRSLWGRLSLKSSVSDKASKLRHLIYSPSFLMIKYSLPRWNHTYSHTIMFKAGQLHTDFPPPSSGERHPPAHNSW